MNLLFYFYIFYSGACFASFLYLVAMRQNGAGKAVSGNRSQCDYCHTPLNVKDLFPIFSFLWNRGSCSYCHTRLAPAYLWGELTGGILSLLLFLHYKEYLVLFVLCGITYSLLFLLASIDQLYYLLPDVLQTSLFFFFILLQLLSPSFSWKTAFIGLLGLSFLGIVSSFLVPEGIGGGDLKLMAIFGFGLGIEKAALVLLIASFLGILFFLHGFFFHKRALQSEIPFGPFLISAFFIVKEGPFLLSFLQ